MNMVNMIMMRPLIFLHFYILELHTNNYVFNGWGGSLTPYGFLDDKCELKVFSHKTIFTF